MLSVAAILGQRTLGVYGFYAVSIAGGLVSSASAVAAAGTAAAHHEVGFPIAAKGAVLASLTSVLVNIPLVARTGAQPRLTKAVAWTLLIIVASGVLGVLLQKPLITLLRSAWPLR